MVAIVFHAAISQFINLAYEINETLNFPGISCFVYQWSDIKPPDDFRTTFFKFENRYGIWNTRKERNSA